MISETLDFNIDSGLGILIEDVDVPKTTYCKRCKVSLRECGHKVGRAFVCTACFELIDMGIVDRWPPYETRYPERTERDRRKKLLKNDPVEYYSEMPNL